MLDLTLPLAGFGVGVLIGLTGMGGGALMTPFLILILGTRPVIAVGTDLVYGAVTKLVGAYLHWRQGTVDLRLALRLAAASVPSGLAAVVALRLLPDAGAADHAVRQALGVALVAVALLLMARLVGASPLPLPARWRHACRGGGTYAAGALVGALVGFTSVGSGSLLVPFLLGVLPLAAAQVVGTDVFHAAILVSVTAVAHAQAGTVDWPLAAALLTGSLPGVAVGSWMTTRLPALQLDHLRTLEAEAVHVLREVAAEFARPVVLYSIGKDSSVMLRLAQKAFHPAPIPFPLLHVDTTYKFGEMIRFRDEAARTIGATLVVHANQEAIGEGTQPLAVGTERCCALLKTRALLDALEAGGFDAAIGGARRDEERSRAKERVFSVRDARGQWDPKRQRPELWRLLNARLRPGETIRVFPLSNWTEIDVWQYIHVERIPIVPLYFAREREVIVRGGSLLLPEQPFVVPMPGERPQVVRCRMRSLGCSPCTGAIRSDADTVPAIIEELVATRHSERQLRVIDHDQDGSMEMKKREGYF